MAALHAADQKPNIVFIIADDLGWTDVAFHGGNAPTPHLDRLKSEGVELTQHYVAPVCSPTRMGLMTGRCNETTDLATKMPGKVVELRARMDELAKADRDSVVKD